MLRSQIRETVGLRALAAPALISICLFGSTGCASVQAMLARIKSDQPGSPNDRPAALYAGPECQETGMNPNSIFGRIDPEEPRRGQILDLICLPSGGFYGHAGSRFSDAGFERLHVQFSDRRPDPIFAAVMVSDCARTGFCEAGFDPPSVAMMAMYAERYDETSLAMALANEGLGEGIVKAFVKLAMEAKAQALAQKAQFNPTFQEIFVDLPAKLATERWATYAHHAALYTELDRLIPEIAQAVTDDKRLQPLLAKVDELRERYLAQCGDPSCVYDPFFVEASLAIIDAQFAANKTLDVAATASFLFDKSARPTTFAAVLWNRQIERITAHNQRLLDYEAAKKTGLSPALLRARFPEGEPSPRIPGHWIFEGRGGDYERIKSFASEHRVQMARVKAFTKERPGALKVTFHDEVYTSETAECRPTSRIIRYDYQGSSLVPVYDEICGPSKAVSVNEKVEPVVVPERDARSVRAGHTVSYIVDPASGEARILESSDRERALTIRGLKLPARSKAAAARGPLAGAGRG